MNSKQIEVSRKLAVLNNLYHRMSLIADPSEELVAQVNAAYAAITELSLGFLDNARDGQHFYFEMTSFEKLA